MAAATSAVLASLAAAATLRHRALRKLDHEVAFRDPSAQAGVAPHIILHPNSSLGLDMLAEQHASADEVRTAAVVAFLNAVRAQRMSLGRRQLHTTASCTGGPQSAKPK